MTTMKKFSLRLKASVLLSLFGTISLHAHTGLFKAVVGCFILTAPLVTPAHRKSDSLLHLDSDTLIAPLMTPNQSLLFDSGAEADGLYERSAALGYEHGDIGEATNKEQTEAFFNRSTLFLAHLKNKKNIFSEELGRVNSTTELPSKAPKNVETDSEFITMFKNIADDDPYLFWLFILGSTPSFLLSLGLLAFLEMVDIRAIFFIEDDYQQE